MGESRDTTIVFPTFHRSKPEFFTPFPIKTMALFGKKNKDQAVAAPAETPQAAPKDTAPKPKPQADVYTLLLGLSVAALVIGVVFLYLNIDAYGTNPLSGIPR